MLERFKDPLFLAALSQAGVDNWHWYDEIVGDLPDGATDLEILAALDAGGVDNWEWFGQAVDVYEDQYCDHEDCGEFEETSDGPALAEEFSEELPPALTAAEKILLSKVGEEEFEKIRSTFWKRETHNEEFIKSLEVLKTGGKIEDARIRLVELVYGK